MFSVVAGRFAIERAAGAGGMARVFRARDLTTDEPVAIKLLHELGANELRRFEREIAALRQLDHPSVVRYVAHGVEPQTGEPYLALEWLDGIDLARRLEAGPLSVEETLSIARAVASALTAAHELGVVHRDLKPGNVFLVGGDPARAKLLDFGLARDFQSTAPLTRTGDLLGTPLYMAPEQARGEIDLDARVDVHGLGCVMFTCLAGHPPFVANNLVGLLAKIAVDLAPRLRERRPDVPDALDRLVARMLGKRREERPPHAGAVAEALETLAAGGEPAGAPATISVREQRVVCVLLAAIPSQLVRVDAPTLDATQESRGSSSLQLADGTLLVSYTGPESPADLATRAVRSALELRAPAAALSLATGRAMIGRGAPVGEAIERAARALDDAHGVLTIDAITAGLIEGRFEMSSTAHGAIVHAERGAFDDTHTLLGKPTRCVGRERELGAIDGFFTECAEDSVARVVVFTADAGIGKSRLAREAAQRLRGRGAQVIVTRAEAGLETVPFALLGDAVSRAAGIVRNDDTTARRAKLAALVGVPGGELLGEIVVASAREPSDLLAAARENPSLMFEQLRRVVEAWLATVARERPVAIIIEDLHWADLSSLTLLDVVLRGLATLPVLLLGLSRPSLLTRSPELWREHSPHYLRLDPLSARASERLVRDVLGGDLEPAIVRLIVERAGGNALFLEELVRATRRDHLEELPMGIVGTVQLRFDALASDVRVALRAASVFGQQFDLDAVAALVPGLDASRAISALVGAELVEATGDGFAFRHAIVRETAYTLLADEDRAIAHALAACFLERRAAAPAVVAKHFELGRDPIQAASWWDRAAVHALGLDDLLGARRHVEHAVALRGQHSGTSALVLAEAAYWQGDLACSREAAHDAMSRLAPDSTDWITASGIAITSTGQHGDNDGVVALLERVLAREPPAGGLSSYVATLSRAVKQLVWAERLEPVRRALARVEQVRDREPLSAAALALQDSALAYLAYCELDIEQLFACFTRAAAQYTRIGAVRDALQCELLLEGFRAELAGDFVRSREALAHIHERARAISASYFESWASFEIGLITHLAGRYDEGRTRMGSVPANIRDATVFRMGRLMAECLAYRSNDDIEAVRDALVPLSAVAVAPTYAAAIEAARGLIALADGDRERARQLATDALVAFASVGDGKLESRIGILVAGETLASIAPARCTPLVRPHCERVRTALSRVIDPQLRASYGNAPWNVRLLALDAG